MTVVLFHNTYFLLSISVVIFLFLRFTFVHVPSSIIRVLEV